MKSTSYVKRYRQSPKVKDKPPSADFVVRSIRQTVACALLFLICLPLSASDNSVRPYIARVLVASSDIKAVRLTTAELWGKLTTEIPAFMESKGLGGVVDFFELDETDTASADVIEEHTEIN